MVGLREGLDTCVWFLSKEASLSIFIFVPYELNNQLRFHKGRHEIPAIHSLTKHVCLLGCKEPLFVSGHQVIYTVRHFLTMVFQDGFHSVAATTLALCVDNDLVIRMLEVGELGHTYRVRGGGSHTLWFLNTCN